MKFQCPNCGQKLAIESMHGGTAIQCPSCGTNLTVPVSSPAPTSEVIKTLQSNIDRGNMTISQYMAQQQIEGGVDLQSTEDKTSASSILTAEQGRKYQLGDIVAQGGMGAILHAKDANLRRNVAMKVMLDPDKAGKEQILRFIQEAQVTSQIEHPSIVPIYELGVDASGDVFYTMKFVKGRSLQDILEKIRAGDAETIKNYPLSRLLNIFQKVCDAMAFAHSKRVIHRDLKPENVMVGDYGEVQVMDWGLAKVLQRKAKKSLRGKSPEFRVPGSGLGIQSKIGNQESSIGNAAIDSVRGDEVGEVLKTMDGSIMGTPGFMSPEQALGKTDEIDERTDIYALGSILYNILTLHVSVTGRNLDEILANVASGRIKKPTEYNRKESGNISRLTSYTSLPHLPNGRVPDSLSAVAMKALEVGTHRRYQSVKLLQKEIESYQGGYATGAEMAGTWRQFALFVKRHKAVTSLVCLISILITAGSIVSTNLWIRSEKSLQDLRDTTPALAAQAKAFVSQQNLDKALQTISYAIKLEPDSAELRCIKGNILQVLLQIGEADQAYSEALIIEPTNKLAKENQELCRSIMLKNKKGETNSLTMLGTLYPAMMNQQRFDEAMIMARRVFPGTMTLEGFYKQILISRGTKCSSLTVDDKGLCTIDLKGASITNLVALKGMPLRRLNIYGTRVDDLTPLKGMPMAELNLDIGETKISDLSPLRDMPLTSLRFTPKNIRKGIKVIREMKTLKEIGIGSELNQFWSATEFWKKYDAGEFNK
ncbi:MAG: hypothetical protein A2283_23690 [Lentisphaerae bacterium RIFOXYA12_FULL_48_11]|nr:MAG: hypothetical protein A2283_23690 [Lentisphaerae bacterium RIFOXYA12_FULL_48_11]